MLAQQAMHVALFTHLNKGTQGLTHHAYYAKDFMALPFLTRFTGAFKARSQSRKIFERKTAKNEAFKPLCALCVLALKLFPLETGDPIFYVIKVSKFAY